MNKKFELAWFWISVSGFFLMSVSFLLMPLDVILKYDAIGIIPGLLFWLSLMLGITGQIVLGIRRNRRFIKQDMKIRKNMRERLGFIAFGRNKLALCADIVFALSIIGLIIATYITQGTGYICYILLAICVFAFCLHCILNGKTFAYILKYYFKKEETLHVKR